MVIDPAVPNGHMGRDWQVVGQVPARGRGVMVTYLLRSGVKRTVWVPPQSYNEGTIASVGNRLAADLAERSRIIGEGQ